jgi:hypothetical protein
LLLLIIEDILKQIHNRPEYHTLEEQQQQRQQPFSYISDDSYTTFTTSILEESEKLYNKVITKLTDSAIGAAAAITVSLPLSGNNNNQKLTYKNDRYERGTKI